MAKRKFQLTSADIEEIAQVLKECKGKTAQYRRLNAVRLYGSGISITDVQERYGCSRSTLLSWCKDFRILGAESLVDMRQGGNNTRLTPEQVSDLLWRLRSITPRMVFGKGSASPDGECWTAKDLCRVVRQWYGVVYQSRNSYYRLLQKYQIPTRALAGRLKRVEAAIVQI